MGKCKEKQIVGEFLTRWPFLVALLLTGLLLSGCINPFHSKASKEGVVAAASSDSGSTGTVQISVNTPLSLSTIAPDGNALASNIAYYSLRLVDPSGTFSDVTRANLNPGSFPVTLQSLHAIPWELTVTAYNGSGFEIGSSGVVSLVVTGGVNPVSVTISALQSVGVDGSLSYNLTWPAGRVNVSASSVNLLEVTNSADPLSGAVPYPGFSAGSDYNFIGDTQLSVNTQVPSGRYYLEVQLHSPAGVDHPPIYEAVQIYDHLGSSKTVTLTAAEFTDPPSAPVAPIVVFDGENSFALRWNDSVNTELGFRVYEQGFGAPVADVGPGIEVAPALTSQAYAGAPTDVTFEIYAYNAFGESPSPLIVDFRVVPDGQLSSFLSSTHTNQESWAAANDAGVLDWGTLVAGGADTTNAYVSNSNTLNDVTALPGAAATPGSSPFPLSSIAPFARGDSYSWRIELVKSSGNPVRVFTPARTFSIRQPALYVSQPGGAPGAAGSSADPIDSAGEAITLAESGETIYLTSGTYVEPLSTVPSNVSFSGSWDSAFSSQNIAIDTILRNSTGQYTLDLGVGNSTVNLIEIHSGTHDIATGAIRYTGGNLAVTACRIRTAVVNTPGDGPTNAYGVLLYNSGPTDAVTIEQSDFEMDNTTDSTTIYQIRINNGVDGIVHIYDNSFLSIPGGLTNIGYLSSIDLQSGSLGSVDVELAGNQFFDGVQDSVNGGLTTAVISSSRSTATLIITGNTIGDITGPGSFYGIRVLDGAQMLDVFSNWITLQEDEGNEYGIFVEGPVGSQALFRENRIRNVVSNTAGSSYGVYIEQTGVPSLLYNNVIHGEGTSTLWFYGIASVDTPIRAIHNTIVTTHAGPADLVSIRPDTQDIWGVTVSNNIFRGESASTVTGIAADGTHNVDFTAIHANALSGLTVLFITFPTAPLFDLTQLHSELYAEGNVDADPMLEGAAAWFSLSPMTPALVAEGGYDYTPTVGRDIDGTVRTLPVSMGAYEQ